MAWGRGRDLPADWHRIVTRIKVRDKNRCTWVMKSGRRCPRRGTEVDHVGDPADHSDRNLRLLCEAHHKRRTQEQALAARTRKPPKRPQRHPGSLRRERGDIVKKIITILAAALALAGCDPEPSTEGDLLVQRSFGAEEIALIPVETDLDLSGYDNDPIEILEAIGGTTDDEEFHYDIVGARMAHSDHPVRVRVFGTEEEAMEGVSHYAGVNPEFYAYKADNVLLWGSPGDVAAAVEALGGGR